MSERERFGAITVLLVGALILSVAVVVGGIQEDLLRRTQNALATAGVAFYGLEFDGRDAILGGFVPSRQQAERIASIVAAVPGVRAVCNELVIERVVESAPRRASVTAAELRVQRLGSMLVISGRLGAADAGSIVDAAERAFGTGNVRSSVRVDGHMAPSEWLGEPTTLIGIMSSLSDTGRLSVRGRQAVLGGRIRGADARRRIGELASSIPGLRWRFDLFAAGTSAAVGGST